YQFYFFFFFFQAEDGIRDGHVTGVQTCALPISWVLSPRSRSHRASSSPRAWRSWSGLKKPARSHRSSTATPSPARGSGSWPKGRSEERRVGKECGARWAPQQEKKNK